MESLRRRGNRQTDPQRSEQRDQEHHSHVSKDSNHNIPCFTWSLILLIFYVTFIGLAWFAINHLPHPKLVENSKPEEFTEERARKHLETIVKVGARPAGSWENEVYALKYILTTVAEIKRSAHSSKKIEVDVQRPTGSFFLDFIDGYTSYYSNITNTVVKISSAISSDHALLLNCHTDSVINAPGASDDAVACAILLEIIRAVMVDKTPLLHQLIFLFNGAEENVLQGSHGFITQHKWAKQIKAFINLEAAGAGGKEFVFQTGPENPWLAWAWTKHAPFPHGSSVGQELFQSGIIPSDTDFRIYRDYGRIPGIDIAYVRNGYVYHTLYDSDKMIPPGSIQRAGENIISVVRHLIQSPESLLADPSDYRHGNIAFFDYYGLVFVAVPEKLLVFMTCFIILGILAYIGKQMIRPQLTGYNSFQYNSKLMKAIAVTILGNACSILCLTLMALFLTYIGMSKCWFSKPILAVGLYLPAGLIGLLLVHMVARKTVFKNDEKKNLEGVFFDAVLILSAVILFQARNLQSSWVFSIWPLFATLGRVLVARDVFSLKSGYPGVQKLVVYLFILALPTSVWINTAWIVGEFFIPLAGRSGTDVPPDVIMILLFGFFTLGCFKMLTGFIYLVDNLKWLVIGLGIVMAASIFWAVSSKGLPYAVNEENPMPKRLVIQHMNREYFDAKGQLYKQDSGIVVVNLDYMDEMHCGSELLHDAPFDPCHGTYCELCWLLPIQKLARRVKYIPYPPVLSSAFTDITPFEVKIGRSLIEVDKEIPNMRTFRVQVSASGPSHMALHISPIVGNVTRSKLIRWSFDADIKLAHSKYGKKSNISEVIYYVYYGAGLSAPPWDFWLDFSVEFNISGNFQDQQNFLLSEIAIYAHYVPSGPVSKVNNQTPELRQVTSELEDWVAPMSWVSLYKHYLI